jgi:membrane-bound serine protease (ClpP class)
MTALGVSLLFVGAIVILVEAHFPTLGMLGVPGVVALAVGSVLAVGGLGGGLLLGLLTALVLAGAAVGGLALSLRKGGAASKRRISTGAEGLIGHLGVVRSWREPGGNVLVDGALWRARRGWSEEPEDERGELREGDPIVVERLTGLTLTVRPAEEWELAP